MNFQSPINEYWLLAAAVALAVAVIICWLRVRASAPHGRGRVLPALRLALVGMLALLVLNPYVVEEQPVRDGFRVGVLADVSGSMHTADIRGNRSRIEVVRAALDPAASGNLRSRLSDAYALRVSAFTSKVSHTADPAFELLPGTTAIGNTLIEKADLMSDQGAVPGAILLLSDGISLDGISLPEAAVELRDRAIPVTVVGVGASAPPGDIKLFFNHPPAQAEIGEPVVLDVEVSNEFSRPHSVEVEFFEGDDYLESRTVEVPAAGSVQLSLEATPAVPGPAVYRARLKDRVSADINPANDTAFAMVEVLENRKRAILYLASRPDFNFRFLRMAMAGDADFHLRSILKLGEERYHYGGFDTADAAAEWQGFPADEGFYFEQSVILVEAETLDLLPAGMDDLLRRFLAERGGGILVLGNPAQVEERWRFLFPVRDTEVRVERSRNYLELIPDPVFADLSGGILFTTPPPFLPADEPVILAANLSLAGRPVMEVRGGDAAVLAIQAYGAGRTAWLGTRGTWQWRMDSARGMDQHALFWRHLLDWLGAAGRPRVDMPIQGTVVSLDQAVDLDLDLRGRDFRPAEEGIVEAVVSTPDGVAAPPVRMIPSPYEAGRFTGQTTLESPGEYRVDYRIRLADGEHIDREAFFLAAFTGRESRDLRFRENDLRDLARITGGRYYDYKDMDGMDTLNLSAGIPTREIHHHWAHTGWFLSLLLLLASLEWFLRRRWGMR